jgi:hypothetical protein
LAAMCRFRASHRICLDAPSLVARHRSAECSEHAAPR